MDAKWFKMERERYPDGFDPQEFLAKQDEPEPEDAEEEGADLVRRTHTSTAGAGAGGDRKREGAGAGGVHIRGGGCNHWGGGEGGMEGSEEVICM